jgi:tRNA threonylcarbamoyl adenosine modification protein YeaZ
MTILALECSSQRRSVAIAAGGRVLAESSQTSEGGAPLFSMIEDALSIAAIPRDSIDTLAVGLGPGSYTGIRGAIAMALGWELATGCLTIGVSSSSACARRARVLGTRGRAAVVIDAQRGEFYVEEWRLDDEGESVIAPLRLATRADVEDIASAGAWMIGPDVAMFGARGRLVMPDATAIAELAMEAPPAPAQPLTPIYLRPTAFARAAPARAIS